MDWTPRKCFTCGSQDHLIAKYPKPPKENEKRQKQVCFNENLNRACDNGKNNNDQKIYTSLARMSVNDQYPSVNFGDSLQLTNYILYSGATCHMTLQFSNFIPISLEETDNILKLRTDITSHGNNKVKFK